MNQDLTDRVGFDAPSRRAAALKRRTSALIAAAALLISLIIAATVVSIEMARADTLSLLATVDDGGAAFVMMFASVMAGVGIITTLATRALAPVVRQR